MKRWRIQFVWFDIWVGVYVDSVGKRLYFCPLPFIVLSYYWGKEQRAEPSREMVQRPVDRGPLFEVSGWAYRPRKIIVSAWGLMSLFDHIDGEVILFMRRANVGEKYPLYHLTLTRVE